MLNLFLAKFIHIKVSLLLGNDLAGDKVMVNFVFPIEHGTRRVWITSVCPLCAATRTMAWNGKEQTPTVGAYNNETQCSHRLVEGDDPSNNG